MLFIVATKIPRVKNNPFDFGDFCSYTMGMAGRPKKKASERREDTLRIRLTAEEREKLDKASALKALDTSTWARMVLVERAKKEGV